VGTPHHKRRLLMDEWQLWPGLAVLVVAIVAVIGFVLYGFVA